ncbi:MAG: hypothetical protein F6K00_20130 [Leptolyngbya sp. SIOISBB]|nr:hypothetical protein [Leptolyngbya sp. SIOISBB]
MTLELIVASKACHPVAVKSFQERNDSPLACRVNGGRGCALPQRFLGLIDDMPSQDGIDQCDLARVYEAKGTALVLIATRVWNLDSAGEFTQYQGALYRHALLAEGDQSIEANSNFTTPHKELEKLWQELCMSPHVR